MNYEITRIEKGWHIKAFTNYESSTIRHQFEIEFDYVAAEELRDSEYHDTYPYTPLVKRNGHFSGFQEETWDYGRKRRISTVNCPHFDDVESTGWTATGQYTDEYGNKQDKTYTISSYGLHVIFPAPVIQ